MIQKVKSLQTQLGLMSQIVSQMKKDKESAAKQVKDIEAALTAFIQKIRVRCFAGENYPPPPMPPFPCPFSTSRHGH